MSDTKTKILIVDDDHTNLLLLRSLLGKLGYDSVQAKNGREAIELYQSENPDIILMDIMMPEVNGYEATSEIRRLETDTFTPIIFITVLSDDESLAKCIEVGGNDFLNKPYNTVIIDAKIRSFLSLRQLYSSEKEKAKRIQKHNEWLESEYTVSQQVINKVLRKEALDEEVIQYKISPKAIFNGDILMMAKTPEDSMRVLIGDFTGHGLSGAIGSIPVAGIFSSMTQKGFAIDSLVKEINQRLRAVLPVGLFLAAAIIEYDPVRRRLQIWNGGSPDVVVYSSRKNEVSSLIASANHAFAMVDNDQLGLNIEEMYLEPGDRVLAFTDGAITASENGSITQTGVTEHISAHKGVETLFLSVVDLLGDKLSGGKSMDDLTIIEITAFDRYISESLIEDWSESELVQESNGPTWKLDYDFDFSALQKFDPIPMIIQTITEMCKIDDHKQSLYMLLREIFSNALEHGILQLDSRIKHEENGFERYYNEREVRIRNMNSGNIKIEIHCYDNGESGQMEIWVEDSGDGFDFSEVEKSDAKSSYHGRGVSLLNQLAREISYNEKGNQIRVLFAW